MILRTLVAFALMGGIAFAIARSTPFATPIIAWLVISAALCALGALALQSQPVGMATSLGEVGGLFVRWGFAAGHGKLWPAVIISWMVWAVFGCAVIIAARHANDRELQILIMAWAADTLGLMYIVGLVLARGGGPMTRSLLPVVAVLIGMIAVSAFQWSRLVLPGGRQTALIIGAGPPLIVGAGYALFLLFALTVGRNARWN